MFEQRMILLSNSMLTFADEFSNVTTRALAKTLVMLFAQLLMANQCQPVLPAMSF